MKYLLTLTLVGSLLFLACKKNNDSPANDEFLTAKIDGVEFTADKVDAFNAGIFFQIYGFGAEGDGDIAISLNDTTVAVGSYEDGVVEGEFNFEAEEDSRGLDPNPDVIILTEGKFSAKYL